MIIKTRYRDIPYEDAAKCLEPEAFDRGRTAWPVLRGKPVEIISGPVPCPTSQRFICDGPFFVLHTINGKPRPAALSGYPPIVICAHHIEIGD